MKIQNSEKLSKDYEFNRSNSPYINYSYLEFLFGVDSFRSENNKLDREEIKNITKELECLLHLQETDRLDGLLENEQKPNSLNKLENQLRHLTNKIHNLNIKNFPKKERKEAHRFTAAFDSIDLYRMKREILLDLIQTIITIYSITEEEEFNAKDIREISRHISANMWCVNTKLDNFFKVFLPVLNRAQIA
ncbi:hypothetical protein [Bacillus pseudomycoides]|uniref:hypothetical protein n=1 Tax=Bacillus pseudomycoides TaxID=64104 RepID=UPI000BEB5D46|nr:hypothetical protein [Bacillus pseudomycoides]PED08999.1 hypothetical protein COO19_07695 [Bacillus pseudomycoides]PEI94514.1 hypothetical protein CN686_15380 [Bacillus pseudomycoides]PEK13208.1 hypothetical protein CN693_24870 [Bacillus pseudomycoides]PEM75692.1 hypothetical protein CN619_09450 [Bacillus pseudomycoides]PEO15080.1 hypothetical protein CN542_18005 [Bacillus pseudomycoides]